MTRGRGWRRVFRLDVGRDHVERDVDEEIAFHLGMRADTLRRQGVADDLAGGQARLRFGDLPAIRAELLTIDHGKERAVKRGRTIEHLGRDLAYAIRALRHHAGFSAVVVLTLALGIGANTAIFSIVDALLLRAIPVSHPEQLVAIGNVQRVNSWSFGSPRTDLFSYPLYKDLRDHNTVFSGLYGNSDAGQLDVVGARSATGDPVSAATPDVGHPNGRFVTANFFDVLGVRAARGRVFAPGEDRVPGDGAVVVISDRYWQSAFNRDPAVVGRTITVNHVPMTVVGVTPPRFTGDIVAQTTDLWIPVSMQPLLAPEHKWLDDRQASWLLLMGRLKPGVSFSQARDQMVVLTRRMLDAGTAAMTSNNTVSSAQYADVPVTRGARGFSHWRQTYAQSLYTLMVAVALVLLIVCANVANLLLGRATSRGREIGVRLALGAGRGRVVQQLLIESLTLAVAGAALGLLVARWAITILLHVAAGGGHALPVDARLSGSVLAFTAALTIGTALLFGLAPALRATRVDLAQVLRAHSRGISGTWRRFGAGRLLVMAQVALSLTMLVATGMVVRSLRALESSDMGLDRDHLVMAPVSAEQMSRSDAAVRVMRRQLSTRLAAIPGVAAVTYSVNGIFGGNESATSLTIPGFVARTEQDSTVNVDWIGPGYFHAIGARMLRGRDLADGDAAESPQPVVVNAAFAAKFLAGQNPIDHVVVSDSDKLVIVGVAADVHDHDLRGTPPPRLYLPMGDGARSFAFVVRAAGDPARLVQPIRQALSAAEPSLTLYGTNTLVTRTLASIRQDVLMARFVSAFGILALTLAAMGLYGILSYATLRRTGEFGLRLALGAQPRDIIRMVLRDGLRLMVFGLLAGLPLLVVGMRLLRSQLFGVPPADPVSIVFAVVVLGASAVVAGLFPALRAARVEPLVAMRTE